MQRTRNQKVSAGAQAGGALVMVALATAVMATLSFSVLALSLSGAREQRTSKEQMSARFVCEAGLAQAVFELGKGNGGALGSKQAPLDYDGAEFWVEATDLGNQQTRLVGTGEVDRAGERIELTVREIVNTKYIWGAFGDLQLDMSSNARVDSYDATLGTYASQAVNQSGSNQHANESGDVGSNNSVNLSQNAKVWGDATPGPGSATTTAGSNYVITGSTTPMGAPMAFPSIDVPAIASTGNLTVSGTGTLPSGDHHFGALTVGNGSQLLVTGPARIVVDDFKLNSNSSFKVDATNGPVEVYVVNDFVLSSNTLMASTDFMPKNLEVLLLSDNIVDPNVVVDLDTVDFNSNAKLYGTIYAPEAYIDVNSNFELFGSLVAKKVRLRSNSTIHYDESLATSKKDGESTWQVVCWRPLAYEP